MLRNNEVSSPHLGRLTTMSKGGRGKTSYYVDIRSPYGAIFLPKSSTFDGSIRRFTAALSAAFAGGRSSQMVRVILDRQCVLQASRKVAVVYSRRTHASYCCTIYVHSIINNEQETSPSPYKCRLKN